MIDEEEKRRVGGVLFSGVHDTVCPWQLHCSRYMHVPIGLRRRHMCDSSVYFTLSERWYLFESEYLVIRIVWCVDVLLSFIVDLARARHSTMGRLVLIVSKVLSKTCIVIVGAALCHSDL